MAGAPCSSRRSCKNFKDVHEEMHRVFDNGYSDAIEPGDYVLVTYFRDLSRKPGVKIAYCTTLGQLLSLAAPEIKGHPLVLGNDRCLGQRHKHGFDFIFWQDIDRISILVEAEFITDMEEYDPGLNISYDTQRILNGSNAFPPSGFTEAFRPYPKTIPRFR